jgi:hypothetical protein
LQEALNNSYRVKPLYGLTYLTAITNLIPRAIWPTKPRAGATVFTQDYIPGFYDEFNDWSTGLYTEAIINFGRKGGIIFATLALIFLNIFLTKKYFKWIYSYKITKTSFQKTKLLIMGIILLWSLPMLVVSEFTNTIVNLLIKLFTIQCTFFLIKRVVNNKKLNFKKI